MSACRGRSPSTIRTSSGHGADPQLPHGLTAVVLDRLLRNAQARRDLLVQQTIGYPPAYLMLAGRQQLEALTLLVAQGAGAASHEVLRHGASNRAEKLMLVDGLDQYVHGPDFIASTLPRMSIRSVRNTTGAVQPALTSARGSCSGSKPRPCRSNSTQPERQLELRSTAKLGDESICTTKPAALKIWAASSNSPSPSSTMNTVDSGAIPLRM